MSEQSSAEAPAASWAIVELMGHRKLAGQVSEEIRFGAPMCRIDVPAIGEVAGFTQYYGGQAIFSMTPVSEQVARGVAAKLQARAVSIYDLSALAGDRQARLGFRGDDDDDDDRF